MRAPSRPITKPRKSEAQLTRDAALLRIVRTRRFVIAGTAALTAGFAAVVSSIAPGRTLRRTAASTPTVARTPARHVKTSLKMPPLASAGDLGLQGPTSAPQASPSSGAGAPAPQQNSAPAPQQSAPVTPAPAQAAPAPAQAAPAPAPAPVPAPAAVSGGS